MTPATASRLRTPAAVLAAGAALGAALLLRDPHVRGSWGWCPFLVLTGQPCPACGGLRATNDLLHGRVGDAVGSNAYAAATAVLAAVAVAWWATTTVRGRPWPLQRHVPRLLTWWFVGLVAFGLVRLLPGMTELRP